MNSLRKKVRDELESPAEARRFGTGWLSGVAALLLAIAGLSFVLCLRYPSVFTVPAIRGFYERPVFRLILHLTLIAAFGLSIISLLLRTGKIVGFSAITITLLAGILGGSRAHSAGDLSVGRLFFGLDWFVLNVIFTGFLFVPLERLFPRRPGQPLFREEWREDLFYYLVSSLLVQVLTFLSMAPAFAILANTHWAGFRTWMASQPVLLQIIEIMFLTDLVQYWVHRAFHRIPFLWGFHAVHHSARTLDWMAGARMHFFEIIILRGMTVIPMYVLGFSELALHGYILLVYIQSGLVHANVGWSFGLLDRLLVSPRFHHWHHGADKEAIDVNFAIHFPFFDRIFGTYYFPPGQWPTAYGIEGDPVPSGYWRQFLHPFRRKARASGTSEPKENKPG